MVLGERDCPATDQGSSSYGTERVGSEVLVKYVPGGILAHIPLAPVEALFAPGGGPVGDHVAHKQHTDYLEEGHMTWACVSGEENNVNHRASVASCMSVVPPVAPSCQQTG